MCFQRKIENKSHNLTYCASFQPLLLIMSVKSKVSFRWQFEITWATVSVAPWYGFLMIYSYDFLNEESCLYLFLNTNFKRKTMSRKFHELCSIRDSTKDFYFLRFHNGNRNMFKMSSERNSPFIFISSFLCSSSSRSLLNTWFLSTVFRYVDLLTQVCVFKLFSIDLFIFLLAHFWSGARKCFFIY